MGSRGGEALSLDTKVIITIDGNPQSVSVGEYLTEVKEDNLWGIGEGFVYPVGREERVEVTVVDIESNSVIMLGTFQGT